MKKQMYKTDLALKVARRTAMDERASLRLVNMILDEISTNLKKGNRVTLTGFGSFVVRKKKRRIVNNGITDGQDVVVPAHRTVGFIPSTTLKDLLRRGR